MLSLDRSKNDTSVTLDLLRAAAAQMVCVGHTINLGTGIPLTVLPNVGVLTFFVLSGFLIAYTLSAKSRSDDYGLATFGIERFSRIYTAYLPAIFMIAAADYFIQFIGHPIPLAWSDPLDLQTLLGNLTMREGMPSEWGVSTLGSAGHLKSVALEFHIYFFVGAIFFLLKGRNVVACAIVAVLFSTFPLGYFQSIPDSDRTLFVMWLAGFAAYYVAASIRIDRSRSIVAALAFVGLLWYWLTHRTPNDYDLSNYPAFALAFLALVIVAQSTRWLTGKIAKVIAFFADYSFSLFLIHLTIIKIILLNLPASTPIRIAAALLAANLAAIGFAYIFEQRYRQVADILKGIVFRRAVGLLDSEPANRTVL